MKKHIYILLILFSFGYLHAENESKKYSETPVNECEFVNELIEEPLRVRNSNITVDLPPTCVINSPMDGEENVSLTPLITWHPMAVEGVVTDYRIRIGTTAGGSQFLQADLGLNTSFTPPTLAENTPYFITIIMTDELSDPPALLGICESSFTTGSGSVPSYNITSPTNEETGVDLQPTITWMASEPGLLSYAVSIGPASGGGGISYDVGATTSFTIPTPLIANTIYNLTITMFDNITEPPHVVGTCHSTFTTGSGGGGGADECLITHPVNGENNVELDLTISWEYEFASTETIYMLSIGTVNFQVGTATIFTLPFTLDPDTAYSVTITMLDPPTLIGGCSSNFTTGSACPPAPTIDSPSQSFCENDNPTVADLVATGLTGTIQWYTITGIALDGSTSLVNGATYYATQTVAGCESEPSSNVVVTITPSTSPVTTTPQDFCGLGANPAPTIADLQPSPSGIIQWYDENDVPLDETVGLINGATYYYISLLIPVCGTGISNDVVVNVNTVNPPTVVSPLFCDSDNPRVGDLTATGTNIQWYDENDVLLLGGEFLINGATYHATQTVDGCESGYSLDVVVTIMTTPIVDILLDVSECSSYILPNLTVGSYYTGTGGTGTPLNVGDTIITNQTIYIYATNGDCSNESSFTVTINTVSPPTVPPSQTFCDSDNPIVGNLLPSGEDIQWYDASNTQLLDSETLINGAIYHATQIIDGCESASSANVIVTIEVTPIVDVLLDVSECSSYLLPILTVGSYYTGTGGTGTPLNVGDTIITNQTIYIYATTPSGNCIDESSFTVTINSTNSPVITTPQTFCDSDNPTILDLEITGIIGTVNWYNENDELLDDTTSLTNGASYYATQTVDGCESTASSNVIVTVETTPIVDTLPNASECDTYILPTLTVGSYHTGTGGTGTPLNAGDIISTNQTIYIYATTPSGNCSNESTFTVTINSTNSPTVASPQIFCDLDNSTVADLQVIEATGVIQWYDENDTPLSQATILVNGATYYATQTVDDCESTASINVIVNIEPTPIVDILTDVSECDTYILPTLITGNYYTGSGGTGATLNAGDAIITTQTIYIYAANGTCIDESSFTITIPVFETVSPQMFCIDDNSTISNIDTGGVEVQWFETQTSEIPLDEDTPLVSGVTYYATQTCDELGQDRFPVTISIDVCDFYVPNAFTPDDDGLNDTYNIPNIDLVYPDYIIYIYDRWGNNVYEGKNGWDGVSLNDRTIGSGKVIQGTYYMLIVLNSSETLKRTLLIEY